MSLPATRSASLLPNHRNILEAAIDHEVVERRGYRSLCRADGLDPLRELSRLGLPAWARSEDSRAPGLLIPLYGPSGAHAGWQYRPDRPPIVNGKTRKYANQRGRTNVLDVHPSNRNRIADPTVPLWITEGVKKADALTSRGCCAIHLSGVFNWRSTLGVIGDWEEVPLKGRRVFVCFDSDVYTNPTVCSAMGRLGRWLKSRQAGDVKYVIPPQDQNSSSNGKVGVDDWLVAGGVFADLVAGAADRPPELVVGDEFTDAHMAERLAEECFAGRHIWVFGSGWHVWTGTHWDRCDERVAIESARSWMRERYSECEHKAKLGEADPSELKSWRGFESASRLVHVSRLASGIDGVFTDSDELDSHPHLLNTLSVVVDLSNGEEYAHDPGLLLTKVTRVAYDAGADDSDLKRILEAVPEDCLDWLHVKLGQAITGFTDTEDELVIFWGGGSNGKSTLVDALWCALGDGFFQALGDRVILGGPNDHPTELMSLKGARVAVLEETPESRRLNMQRVKKLIGTNMIAARYIRQNEVRFRTTHTMFLTTNYRPVVEETDEATWRRLVLLPFPFHFCLERKDVVKENDRLGDPDLRFRVRNGDESLGKAFLTWLVDGAFKWFLLDRRSPTKPEGVSVATSSWRRDSDVCLRYFEDRLTLDPGFYVTVGDLLDDFNDFLGSLGQRPWSEKLLKSRFVEHDRLSGKVQYFRVRRNDSKAKSAVLSRPPVANMMVRRPEVPSRFHALFGVRFDAEPLGKGSDSFVPREDHR